MNELSVKIPKKVKHIIGVDEVGRGPLAGPVTVCAVAIPRNSKYNKSLLKDFVDSKKINHKRRVELSDRAKEAQNDKKIKYSISSISAEIIDKKGISYALKTAIKRSLKKIGLKPDECMVLLDGSLKAPTEYIFQKTIIRGDDKVKLISCASVLAKVKRDNTMVAFGKKYSKYNFEQHKGYGTEAHIFAIKKYGISEIHRQSFLKNL